MLSIPGPDAPLLRSIGRRRRDAFRRLHASLLARARSVAIVEGISDVDGPAALRMLVAPAALRELFSLLLRSCHPSFTQGMRPRLVRQARSAGPSLLRGPPLAA